MAANSGRKAAPPALRLLNGRAEGKDIAGRPVPPPLPVDRVQPEKPENLSADAGWLWDMVLAQYKSIGLLKPLDASSLEVACETFARWREAVRQRKLHGMLGKNSQGVVTAPWVGIEERASKDFRSWCAEFGFTPASEKNLSVESTGGGPGSSNPYA